MKQSITLPHSSPCVQVEQQPVPEMPPGKAAPPEPEKPAPAAAPEPAEPAEAAEAKPEEPKPAPLDLSAVDFDKMKAIKPQAEEPPVSSKAG